ncbi:MAG: prolipoprotein diacylglyceryl transferase [Paludibacteraceae bacterium]|nr:prolipoprotein diacylglyceryl transferase [Paludibacteraceae bacterium]
MNLLSIVWNVDPVAFSIGPREVRWYGILWALGIYLCYMVQERIYKREKNPEEWLDKLFWFVVLGAILGARLGHCLFYEWHEAARMGKEPLHLLGLTFNYRNPYIENPLRILRIWEGGLASHGGAIGIILAIVWVNYKYIHKGIAWIFDRLVIGVAFTAFCIRLGNLMNSEIYGGPTSLPWGFIFVRDGMDVPCHPTQIYEMLYCVLAGVVSGWMFFKTDAAKRPGLIFGVWLLIIFGVRFLLEFIKFDQEAFEANFFLNMGQLLSLPFIAWAIYLMLMAYKRPPLK